MDGPDHYREAERLLVLSEGDPAELTDYRVAAAGVHATLAVAAATAMAGCMDSSGNTGLSCRDAVAWDAAAGVPEHHGRGHA